MNAADLRRAVAAATATVTDRGLVVEDAEVLQNSNKVAVRLRPCEVLARVAPATEEILAFEVGLARRLADTDSPVATLDPRVPPRVHQRDGFALTFWTYYPSDGAAVAPADYGRALAALHAGLRPVDAAAPRWTDRVATAQALVADPDRTPALADPDRALLADTLRDLSRQIGGCGHPEQLLHGEPHPGNLLSTETGLVFIDLETCCHGPVEFDVAHAPEEVAAHYPGLDEDLLRACRALVLAMVTTWRFDRDDQFPDGPALGTRWLGEIRELSR